MDLQEFEPILSRRQRFLLALATLLFMYLILHCEYSTNIATSQIHLPNNPTSKVATNRDNTTTVKTILFWTGFYKSRDFGFGLGQEAFRRRQCPVDSCRTTTDRAEFGQADAVVFSVVGNVVANRHYKLPARMRSDQVYVMVLMESPIRIFYDIGKFKDQFNLTFTYLNHSETDIFAPRVKFMEKNHTGKPNDWEEVMRRKTKLVAWVVSNCKAPSQRNTYVKALQRHLKVDIYGKCGNHTCPRDQSCFTSIARQYKFYLAFENSYCQDYLTEKVYRTLELDLLPVVLGGADYSRVLPPRSYIDVRDFPSPGYLAAHLLRLDKDPRLYLEYFSWKDRYHIVPGYRNYGFCTLCQILHNTSYPYKSGFDPAEYWNGTRWCLRGEAERQAVHLDTS